jgi:hypothetical protein
VELPANKRTDGVPTMGMMSVVGIAMGLLVSLLGHQPGLARVACADRAGRVPRHHDQRRQAHR